MMVINEADNDAQISLVTPDNLHKSKLLHIRNSDLHLNANLQQIYIDGHETNNKTIDDDDQLIASNYAYDKLEQLTYQRQHFWSWQVILILLIIMIIINALIVFCLMNRDSNNKMATSIRFVPLNDFRKRTLATFKLQSPKNVKLDDGMRNCQQLSSFVYCCVITANDNTSFRDKGTHCFRQRSTDLFDHFYKKNMQMTQTWQTLSDDDTVVLLQNMAGGYAMLDTKYGISMPILDNEDYANLTPVVSFFGMDNVEELTALAQDDHKFYICEYLRDSQHRFLLQDCYETTMLKFENPSQIKFCANPIYQAIIQFNNAYTNIKWQLQVTYTTTNGINDNNIYIVDSVDLITDQQIAMICSPFNIDIYMISSNVLVHYAIDLPKIDGETLIGNYF
uniref:Uncharacterized protein n=1 Tax=Onchocerca volvulus TaxID=6282 RepID=A0A8R1XQC7_ONCVO